MVCQLQACIFCVYMAVAAAVKPNFLVILQDDFGFNDVGFHSSEAEPFTSNITAVAKEGMVLDRHYVFWYCSPTRRSFLSGRNPVHHGTSLSGVSDDMDLRWNWISDKLATAGYRNYWYGKGHTGYLSTKHLPAAHNFRDHYGYLGGAEDYTNASRWSNERPATASEESVYSTDAYGSAALEIVKNHDPASPFFIYLPFQAVHTPYDLPPHNMCKGSNSTINQLMCDADAWVGKIVATLKQRGLWENTLIVYSSDNGGIEDGNNFPLRGEKTTDFDGGFRVNAFISGGFVPATLRGRSTQTLVHITDWYPTLCQLAGVDARDDSPVPPLPYDPNHPDRDVWGKDSYPGIDGVNVWDALMTSNSTFNSARSKLILSESALISGQYKLVTGMSHGHGFRPHMQMLVVGPPFGEQGHFGWRLPNGTWELPRVSEMGCTRSITNTTVPPTPCLFDILNDPEERHDLAAQKPDMVKEMVQYLERAWATNFTARSPASLLGTCNKTCAALHYGIHPDANFGDQVMFPTCGVPTCGSSSKDVLII